MLVLTRKKGQSIMVGDDIEICVVGVEGDSVRLGVKAPKDVSIYRQEVFESIREENIRAAKGAAEAASNLKAVQPPAGENDKGSDK